MTFSLPDNATISDIHAIYLTGQATVQDITNYYLEKSSRRDVEIESIVRHVEKFAIAKAKQLDGIIAGKSEGEIKDIIDSMPLFGVPFALKDNILVEGLPITAQSRILTGFKAPYSSDVYNSLEKAGAVLIAQTNMDEFAFGSSTEYSGFGQITKNPWDTTRVPGGTSGGSAAAVASGQVPFAIGTDTGGSIRQPSSFCGVYGLRPTYGTVPRSGVIASASSFDQAGAIANSLEDIMIIQQVLQNKSPSDQTSIHSRPTTPRDKIKIGWIEQYFSEGVDPAVLSYFESLKMKLRDTFEIVTIDLDSVRHSIGTYYILQTVEAAANLERYDGVRYGLQSNSDLFFGSRSYFGNETKRRIMLGTYTSSAGYYDAYYNKACQVREVIRRDFENAFEVVDAIIMPASPFPAFKIGQHASDPIAMYLADIMTTSQPIAKIPSLVVPGGVVEYEDSHLPIGVQIVGPQMSELMLYKIARELEKINH